MILILSGAIFEQDDSVDDEEEELKSSDTGALFDVPSVEIESYTGYGGKRYSDDLEIPALPPPPGTAATACFGEPPLPLPLPLPCGGDDELFSPNDDSPTFEKPREMEKTIEDARFIAQHAKNKDKFESVSNFAAYGRIIA